MAGRKRVRSPSNSPVLIRDDSSLLETIPNTPTKAAPKDTIFTGEPISLAERKKEVHLFYSELLKMDKVMEGWMTKYMLLYREVQKTIVKLCKAYGLEYSRFEQLPEPKSAGNLIHRKKDMSPAEWKEIKGGLFLAAIYPIVDTLDDIEKEMEKAMSDITKFQRLRESVSIEDECVKVMKWEKSLESNKERAYAAYQGIKIWEDGDARLDMQNDAYKAMLWYLVEGYSLYQPKFQAIINSIQLVDQTVNGQKMELKLKELATVMIKKQRNTLYHTERTILHLRYIHGKDLMNIREKTLALYLELLDKHPPSITIFDSDKIEVFDDYKHLDYNYFLSPELKAAQEEDSDSSEDDDDRGEKDTGVKKSQGSKRLVNLPNAGEIQDFKAYMDQFLLK